MTLDDAIRVRRSVRAFLPTEVPEATLHEIFELAQWAPSNCKVQPWVPHVVSGSALQRLGPPDDHRLLFGISFGHEDRLAPANAARTIRAPLHEAVQFHR